MGVSPIISVLRADSAHLSEGLFAPEVGSSSHLSVMLQAANARTPMKSPVNPDPIKTFHSFHMFPAAIFFCNVWRWVFGVNCNFPHNIQVDI